MSFIHFIAPLTWTYHVCFRSLNRYWTSMTPLIKKRLHLDVVSFCYDWGLSNFQSTKRSRAQNTNSGLDWEPHSVRRAGFGPVHWILIFLDLTVAIHRLDNSKFESYIPFMFIVTFARLPWWVKRPSVIMTLVASNIAGLELMIRPLTMILLHGRTYPAFDEVACAFPDPELCPSKDWGNGVRGAKD